MSMDDPNFVSQWQERMQLMQADMAVTLGIEAVSASDTHVEMAMPFRPEIGQATGLFSAGALIQLADVAATMLCIRTIRERDPETQQGTFFPLSIQMNAHLVGNTNSGRAIARSTLVSASRAVMTAGTLVQDEGGKDLVLLTSTHIVKSIRS